MYQASQDERPPTTRPRTNVPEPRIARGALTNRAPQEKC